MKMVMIQDSNQPTAHDKALRITGEASKCQVDALTYSLPWTECHICLTKGTVRSAYFYILT